MCAQGELVLKDGLYMTEEATVFDLEGVYVAATGQLHVQAAPAGGPLRLLLNTSDAGAVEHLPEYRSAQRATLEGVPYEWPRCMLCQKVNVHVTTTLHC